MPMQRALSVESTRPAYLELRGMAMDYCIDHQGAIPTLLTGGSRWPLDVGE